MYSCLVQASHIAWKNRNHLQARMEHNFLLLNWLPEAWKHSSMWCQKFGKYLEKIKLSFNLAFYCLLTKWTQKRCRHINYWFTVFTIFSLQCICFALSVSNCYLIHKDTHNKCFQNMRIPLAGGEKKERMIIKLPGENLLYLFNSPSKLGAAWRWGCHTHLCHSASTWGPRVW